jgi:ATP-dependent helicase/nuclease subunit A
MERDRYVAVTDFSRDMALDASAGTGKTATLIARVTNLFLAKKELLPDRVLLLTFTEKAAAEMKSRVVEGWELLLSRCRSSESLGEIRDRVLSWNSLVRVPVEGYAAPTDLRIRVEEMVDGVGRLSVTTFHSFCRRILLSFPAEAGVDPRFEVIPEGEAEDAWDDAFRKFLRSEFGRPDADPMWERVLSRSSNQESVFGMIRRLCLYQRDLLREDRLDFGTPSDFLDFARREYAGAAGWFRDFVGGITDRSHEMTPVFEAALGILSRAWEAVERNDLDAACALARDGMSAFGFRADRTRSRKLFPVPPGATLAETRDVLKGFWRELAEVPSGDAAARFLVERSRLAASAYEEAKGSRLDFMDLLLRANRLLCGNREVAERVSQRFRYIFVDEFQDTDPLQAGMLNVLSRGGVSAGDVESGAVQAPSSVSAGGSLFLVGDPKQSIYGFRRADVQVYHRFREELIARGGEAIGLVRNFRSRPDLIASINGLFGHVLYGEEDFQPAYSPVVPHRDDVGEGSPVTLFSLGEEVPEPEFLCGLIRKIAGTVAVRDKSGAPERAAEFRDIAVLYRSDTGGEVLASYRDALNKEGIPHVVPSRKGFFARQEVQDLRMVLAAIDAPADPSARYAALKTIFFGLSDEEILSGLAKGKDGSSPRTGDALSLLARLSARRGRASLPELLADLFRESGVEFVAARLPEGERILANLAKAAGLARSFEWGARGSVKAFLAEIRRKTEEERPEHEFPSFEEKEDAVRISTIHLSKGLEFPVVILANLARGGKKPPEGLRVDRVRGLSAVIFPGFRTYSAFRQVTGCGGETTVSFERWERKKQDAEENRLLYVAATRARDRLFLVEGAKGRGSVLKESLHAGLSRGADGEAARCEVTGLSGRKRLFVSERFPDDPGGYLLQVAVSSPLPVAASPPASPSDLSFAKEWTPQPPEPLPLLLETVTLKEFYERGRGRQFGDKVHLALEATPPVLAPWPPPGSSPVRWGDGEEERWRKICRTMVASGIYRDLCRAVLVGTELPMLSCRGGWSKQERADLVVRFPMRSAGKDGIRSGEHWVIDYKTGRRDREQEETYADQVRGYMEILSEAWNVPARGFVWYVETGETFDVGIQERNTGGRSR